MSEHKIQWDLVALLVVFLSGVLMMNGLPRWWARRKKKKEGGFKRMQSPAARARRRRGGKWGS